MADQPTSSPDNITKEDEIAEEVVNLTQRPWLLYKGAPGLIVADAPGQPVVLTIDPDGDMSDEAANTIATHVVALHVAYLRLNAETPGAGDRVLVDGLHHVHQLE